MYKIVAILGPSGSGKDTVLNRIIEYKKYKDMIDEGSWRAIAYLAVPELLFSLAISVLATIKMLDSTLVEIYQYSKSF